MFVLHSSSFLAIFLTFATLTNSARILGVFFIPSYSHHVVFQPIYKELSLRGHQVTVITTNPLKDASLTNLTEINVDFLYGNTAFIQKMVDTPSTVVLHEVLKWMDSLVEGTFKDERVQKIYKDPTRQFDLVLVEALTPLVYAFAGRFNAPLIGIVSMDGMIFNHRSVGNPVHPALYGDMLMPFHKHMTVREKIYYVWYMIYERLNYKFDVIPRANRLAKKYFGKLMQYPIEDLDKNISLLLINSNMVLNPIRPTVPQVVHMGFMHIQPVKPLPTELQHIMGNSTLGVVYFSLGTNVKTLTRTLQSTIIAALGELPYTVLWKREADNIPGLPRNIITRKWFPQQDVLAHENLKVFVMQGGLQSTEEAISRGVPIVGIPFIADQFMIIKKLVELGFAVELDHYRLTKEGLKRAILEVAENKKYKKKVLEIRDIVNDQPMTGLERAVWWCEYIIRHKGASHLRSPRADIPLYEYLLLDVALVVLVVCLLVIYLSKKVLTFLFSSVSSNNRNKAKFS